jgi:hypothetical protein
MTIHHKGTKVLRKKGEGIQRKIHHKGTKTLRKREFRGRISSEFI